MTTVPGDVTFGRQVLRQEESTLIRNGRDSDTSDAFCVVERSS